MAKPSEEGFFNNPLCTSCLKKVQGKLTDP